MQRLDDAGPEVAGNGEADDQRADQRLRLLRQVPQNLGALEAEALLEPEHVAPLAGMDLPAVAPGGAARDAVGLDEHDVGARLGEMDGRRKAGEAAADDADIRPARAVERGVFGNVAERRAGRRTAEARAPLSRAR